MWELGEVARQMFSRNVGKKIHRKREKYVVLLATVGVKPHDGSCRKSHTQWETWEGFTLS